MPSSSRSAPFRWLPVFLLIVGLLVAAAFWIALSLRSGSLCSWVAVVVALDAAVLLRIGGLRPGAGRAGIALLATAATVVLSLWSIVALQIGLPMGLGIWDALTKLGFDYARTLLALAASARDAVWIGAGLLTAIFAGK